MRFLLAVLLFAPPCFAQSKVPVVNPEAACGNNDVEFSVKPDPRGQIPAAADSGKALVYFVETQKIDDLVGNVTAKIAVDGAWVGANQGDSFFFVSVAPGEHHLCASWQSSLSSRQQVSLNNLAAEVGKTYYFRIRITGDDRSGYSFDLLKINSDEAQLLIARSPYSISRAKK